MRRTKPNPSKATTSISSEGGFHAIELFFFWILIYDRSRPAGTLHSFVRSLHFVSRDVTRRLTTAHCFCRLCVPHHNHCIITCRSIMHPASFRMTRTHVT